MHANSERPLRRLTSASTWCRNGWTLTHTVAALLLMTAAVLSTLDAWNDILDIAVGDVESSHIFLVPLVAAWLVWIRRERMRDYTQYGTWIGPLVVAAGWVIHRVGDAYMIQSFWHFGAILVLVGAFLAVAGVGFLLRFFPAVVSLCFLVPVPGRVRQEIALPLQSATASVTQAALETLGVAVQRSGNMLSINGQDVTIAEACNGLRMVFALVMVSYAFAYGAPLRNGFRMLVLLLCPITAVVFNVVRLVPTVWAFGSFSADFANSLHDLSGWLMLPCAFFGLVGIMRLLRWAQIRVTPYVLAHGS